MGRDNQREECRGRCGEWEMVKEELAVGIRRTEFVWRHE